MKKSVFIIVTIFLLASSLVFASYDLEDGNMMWWSCDDDNITGTTLYGSSPNEINGTIGAQVESDEGIIGESCTFNTENITGRNITTTTNPYDINTGSYTVSFWLKLNSTSGSVEENVFTNKNSSASPNYRMRGYLQANGTMVHFVRDTAETKIRASTPSTQIWYHFVLARDVPEDDFLVYMDGVLKKNQTDTGTDDVSDNEIWLFGTDSRGALSINGSLDEIGIWNRTLNEEEIDLLYNDGRGWNPYKTTFRINNITTRFTLDELNISDVNVTIIPGGTQYSDITNETNMSFDGSSATIRVSHSGYKNITAIVYRADNKVKVNLTNASNTDYWFSFFSYANATLITSGVNMTASNANFSYSENCISTNGSCDFEILQGYDYNFSIRPTNYEHKDFTLAANASHQEYNTSYYLANSLNISFYDEDSGTLIANQTISVEFISNAESASYTTATGHLYVSGLEPDTYIIRYGASEYMDAFYEYEIVNNTHDVINLTMLDKTGGDNVTIYVYDQLGNPLENATVKVQKYDVDTNAFSTNQVLKTNFEGRTVANIVLNNEYYKFLVEYEGAVVLITASTYIYGTEISLYVTIEPSGFGDYYDVEELFGEITYNNATFMATYVWNDNADSATKGCLYAYRLTGNIYPLHNSTCTDGSSGTIYLSVENISGAVYELKGYVTKGGNDYHVASYIVSFAVGFTERRLGLLLLFFLEGIMIFVGFWNLETAVLMGSSFPLIFSFLGLIAVGWGWTAPILGLGLVIIYLISRGGRG